MAQPILDGEVSFRLIVLGYCAVWLGSAFGLLRIGKYIRFVYWPIYPLLGAFESLKLVPKLFSKGGLILLGLTGAEVGVIAWGTGSSPVGSIVLTGVVLMIGAVLLVLIIGTSTAYVLLLRRCSRDRRTIEEWEALLSERPLSIDESMRIWLPKIETEKYLYKLILLHRRHYERPTLAIDFVDRMLGVLELYGMQRLDNNGVTTHREEGVISLGIGASPIGRMLRKHRDL